MFNLEGRVVVVTGASSGLGAQMSRGFAGQGADLVILARRMEKLEGLAEELRGMGAKCLPVQCDVTDPEHVNQAAAQAEAEFGKVDVLVNCAGSAKNAGVLNMTDEEWSFTMKTDLDSVFYVTRALSILHPCTAWSETPRSTPLPIMHPKAVSSTLHAQLPQNLPNTASPATRFAPDTSKRN